MIIFTVVGLVGLAIWGIKHRQAATSDAVIPLPEGVTGPPQSRTQFQSADGLRLYQVDSWTLSPGNRYHVATALQIGHAGAWPPNEHPFIAWYSSGEDRTFSQIGVPETRGAPDETGRIGIIMGADFGLVFS